MEKLLLWTKAVAVVMEKHANTNIPSIDSSSHAKTKKTYKCSAACIQADLNPDRISRTTPKTPKTTEISLDVPQ